MKMEDRLSDLPEGLIHHIMSFLPTEETGKFCVLSKTLSSAWLSFPAIHLDSTVHINCREVAFLDYTRGLLRQLRADPKPLESLSFHLYVYRCIGCGFSTVLNSAAEVLEDLASFALDKSVSSLSLCCEGNSYDFYSPLFAQFGTPRAFSSAVFSSRTIRKIYLRGLNFASSVLTVSCPLIEDFTLFVCGGMRSVEFSSAAKLLKSIEIYKCRGLERIRVMDGLASLRSFSYTGFSNEPCGLDFDLASYESLRLSQNPRITGMWLRDNVAEWPSLETFILDHCENVQTVRVDNQSLKCLELSYCKSLAKIDVAVPDLECFRYSASLLRCGKPKGCEINIGGCTRLKTLEMTGAAASREWIVDNLAPGLLFLEDLKLDRCDFASVNTVKTRFCFENLTSFQLVCPRSISWLEIECPNLASFKYSGAVIPSLPVVISSSLKNAEIGFYGHSFPVCGRKDFLFQRHLKNFISFFGRCNTLSLQVLNSKDNLIIPKQVRKGLIHTSNELKHLQIPLVCLEETENVADFVDSLLWLAHHPETISFVTDYTNPEAKSLIKLRYRHGDASEVSSEGEEDGFTCCSSSRRVKCWRHDLIEVVVENFGDRHAEILQGYFSENTMARISVVSEGQKRFSLLVMMSKITNWFYGK